MEIWFSFWLQQSQQESEACKSTAKKPLKGCFPGWRWESVHVFKSQIKVIAHWSLATSTAAPWACFWVLVYSSEIIQWYAGGLVGVWATDSLGWAKLAAWGRREKLTVFEFFFLNIYLGSCWSVGVVEVLLLFNIYGAEIKEKVLRV